MNNKAFIHELSTRSGFTQEDLQKMVYTMVDVMNERFADALPVKVGAFGIFEVKKRMERIIVNPTTRQRMLVPPKIVLSFRAMTSSKTDLPDIAQSVARRHGTDPAETGRMLEQLFALIAEALDNDRIAKVKGLGTFKLTDIKERESIDVNTGERIVIGSRTRVTFTPDSVLRDLVNKPFAQFDTVVLNVDSEALSITPEEAVAATSDIAEPPSPGATEADSEEKVSEVTAEPAPSDIVVPAESVEPTDSEKDDTPEPSAAGIEPNDEDEDYDDDAPGRHSLLWLWMTLLVCAVAAGMFVLGYYMGSKGIRFDSILSPSATIDTTTAETIPTVADTAAMVAPAIVDSTAIDTSAVTVAPAEAATSTSAAEIASPASTPTSAATDKAQLERARVMVSKGAYNIIGTTETITVPEGKTMKQISKYYFGEGMECYLQVHNNTVEVSEGMRLKIPKLQSKRRRR